MIVKPNIDNIEIIELAKQKLIIDQKITAIIKEENTSFSYKKIVADLGEYHAKKNIEYFFETLEFSPNRVSDCDLKGVLKTEYSQKWDLPQAVNIEVKTRYWQVGSPHLGNVNTCNFDLLVFVSLNEDYSIHYISMVKSSELLVTKSKKVIYNKKIRPIFATMHEYVQHK